MTTIMIDALDTCSTYTLLAAAYYGANPIIMCWTRECFARDSNLATARMVQQSGATSIAPFPLPHDKCYRFRRCMATTKQK